MGRNTSVPRNRMRNGMMNANFSVLLFSLLLVVIIISMQPMLSQQHHRPKPPAANHPVFMNIPTQGLIIKHELTESLRFLCGLTCNKYNKEKKGHGKITFRCCCCLFVNLICRKNIKCIAS